MPKKLIQIANEVTALEKKAVMYDSVWENIGAMQSEIKFTGKKVRLVDVCLHHAVDLLKMLEDAEDELLALGKRTFDYDLFYDKLRTIKTDSESVSKVIDDEFEKTLPDRLDAISESASYMKKMYEGKLRDQWK